MALTLRFALASTASTARHAMCGLPLTSLQLPSYTNDSAQFTCGSRRPVGRCTFGVGIGWNLGGIAFTKAIEEVRLATLFRGRGRRCRRRRWCRCRWRRRC